MFSFFKKKEVKTNGGSGLLPKEIIAEIKGGVPVAVLFGKDRGTSCIKGQTLFLSNKGNKNLLYREVWRTKKPVGQFEIFNWINEGNLPERTKKKGK